MFRYILKRLIQMIPLLIFISIISFGISKMAPGDFLTQKALNPSISPETIAAERARLGLDQPVHIQYVRWATNFVQGDMGQSFMYRTSVSSLIVQRLGNTLILGVAAFLFTWLVAIPLGIAMAVRQYSTFDKVSSGITFFLLGIPEFFLALLLLFAAAKTGILPVGGMTSPDFAYMTPVQQALDIGKHLVIPVFAVAVGSIAILQRRMRGNLLDVLGEEYVRTARAKGLPENKVIYKHAVRNAINPLVTILGYEFASLLSGFALVEIIIGWPGMGMMMLEALQGLDMTLAMAGIMMGAFMLLVGNLLADILLALVDPRIKLEA